jgi:phage shock protein A
MIATMDGKVQQLANQLSEQVHIYKDMEMKYHQAETKIIELEGRLRSLDSEYSTNEVLRDNMKSDKIRVFFILIMFFKKLT